MKDRKCFHIKLEKKIPQFGKALELSNKNIDLDTSEDELSLWQMHIDSKLNRRKLKTDDVTIIELSKHLKKN